jgi:IS1 family transposase
LEKQGTVIGALVEGVSIRSIERMTGIHRDTIMRLGSRIGENCKEILDSTMCNLHCEHFQMDEIWCFVGKKQRHLKPTDDVNVLGDQWIFVALDADSKLIPSFLVGKRSYQNAVAFVQDLSERLDNRVQLSSDSLQAYVDAVELAFGCEVDYGQIVKTYEAEPIGPGRYSPPHVISVERKSISGYPDISKISTSYVERQNLTLRMQMRRLTRLTNAFSKKLENLKAAVALHFAHYNFVRVHQTLKVTPAMEAGLTGHIWSISDLLE